MEEKGQLFLIWEFQLINAKKREIKRSFKYSNNCLKEDPLMNAKISEQNINLQPQTSHEKTPYKQKN